MDLAEARTFLHSSDVISVPSSFRSACSMRGREGLLGSGMARESALHSSQVQSMLAGYCCGRLTGCCGRFCESGVWLREIESLGAKELERERLSPIFVL